jgi:hypothetical protein
LPLLKEFRPFITFQIDSISQFFHHPEITGRSIPGHELSPTVELPPLLRLVLGRSNRALPGWGCEAWGDAGDVASAWVNYLRFEIFGFAPAASPLSPLEKLLLRSVFDSAKIEIEKYKRRERPMSTESLLVGVLPAFAAPFLAFFKSRS